MCVQACLHINPEKRASCSELLRLPYLAHVESTFSQEFLAAKVTLSSLDMKGRTAGCAVSFLLVFLKNASAKA